MNTLEFVSWGVYDGGSGIAQQQANYFASWGMITFYVAPAPPSGTPGLDLFPIKFRYWKFLWE